MALADQKSGSVRVSPISMPSQPSDTEPLMVNQEPSTNRNVVFERFRKPVDDRLGKPHLLLAVAEKLELQLRNNRPFVDFRDIFQAIEAPTAQHQNYDRIRDWPIGSGSKRPIIQSFSHWVKAYYVFMSYRLAEHPDATQSFLEYLDIIAGLADSANGYTTEEWTNYDFQVRSAARQQLEDYSIFELKNIEVFRRTMLTVKANARNGFTGKNLCRLCASSNHLVRDCPKRAIESTFSEIMEKPFRGRAALDGGSICAEFNNGKCSTPSVSEPKVLRP